MGPPRRSARPIVPRRCRAGLGDAAATSGRLARVDAKRSSPYRLRHTFALRSLRSKRDVIAVQKLLGHASVATTQRYLDHLDLAELRAAVAALPLPADEPSS